jgi:pentatricopeptide repeat protein
MPQQNVIIFGAAMSCMEKCCRADICFQLMERMKLEGVQPNVHIYNSVISACARNNLWEKGYELFREMDEVGVKRDVVTFNAVLDAVASQVQLGRMLFEEGVKQGFYARVSRLAKHWFELDLHFLSLGGGEIAMGWWFEVCLVPYLVNKCEKLKEVKSISIVTGYGKTRTRGRRVGDDGMRKRCRAMLSFMGIRVSVTSATRRISGVAGLGLTWPFCYSSLPGARPTESRTAAYRYGFAFGSCGKERRDHSLRS